MAKRWTHNEKIFYADQLRRLYVLENRTVSDIGSILKISPRAVYVAVMLGSKEEKYATHVAELFYQLFGIYPRIIIDPQKGYRIVCLGSVEISAWLVSEELVYNKVAAQVDIPHWILQKEQYMRRFIRGFFDTDGSIYKLKYGTQLSFTNYSIPLLMSLQWSLRRLGYRVSEISGHRFYLTKIDEIRRFFKEIPV